MLSTIFSPADQLSQIHELNRLFLTCLYQRARNGEDCLGMSERVRILLAAADPQALNRVAEFPRSLFDVSVQETLDDANAGAGQTVAELSCSALNMTIMHSAWNLSRTSGYYARLFLGLRTRAVERLRRTTLYELPQLALADGAVRCAFAGSERLWRELLFDDRPEVRQRLGLIVLQPQLALDSHRVLQTAPQFSQ